MAQKKKNVTALASDIAYSNVSKRRQSIPFWDRLDYLSTDNYAVFRDAEDKKALISFTGTRLGDPQHRWSDLATDAKIFTGVGLKKSKYMRDAEKITEEMIRRYGRDNVIVTGHSLGGRTSLHVGAKYDVESHNFNLGTFLPDMYMNIKPEQYKNPDAYKKAHVYVNSLDLIATTSQMVPGATIEYGGEKNQGAKLIKDIALTYAGAKAMGPFEPQQTRFDKGVGRLNVILGYLNKMIGYHSLDQYKPQLSVSTGGSTLKGTMSSGLQTTKYKQLRKEDWSWNGPTSSSAPAPSLEPHLTMQEFLQRQSDKIYRGNRPQIGGDVVGVTATA